MRVREVMKWNEREREPSHTFRGVRVRGVCGVMPHSPCVGGTQQWAHRRRTERGEERRKEEEI